MTQERDALLKRLGELAAARDAETPDSATTGAMEVPLGADAKRRIVSRLKDVVADSGSDSSKSSTEANDGPTEASLRPSTVQFPTRRVASTPWVRLAAAAALVLALGGVAYRNLSTPPTEQLAQSLPSYQLEIEGYSATLRGSETVEVPTLERETLEGAAPSVLTPGNRVFAPGNRLSIVLRPDTASTTPLSANLFALRGDTWVAVKDATIEISELGAVRYEGVVGQDIAVGRPLETLLLVVSPTNAPPTPEDLAAVPPEDGVVRGSGWQAWVLTCRVVSEG